MSAAGSAKNPAFRAASVLAGLLLASGAAPQDRFVDAAVSAQAAGTLASTFRSLVEAARGPEWIAWSVPGVERNPGGCGDCCDGRGLVCRLEERREAEGRPGAERPVRLEGPRDLLVLLRVQGGSVGRIRVFDAGCSLDAGGLGVHWLTGVRPAESLRLLAGYVEPWGEGGGESLPQGALTAIALHADSGADEILEGYAASGKPVALRKQAAFWMGVARGRKGLEDLRRLARQDPEAEVREHVTFALSQSREPEAVGEIESLARRDSSPRVRGQALFWLAQKAGQKAITALRDALDDPDTEVKTRAVFALSQLPADQGVPLLIQQARSNRNPEVRRQAFFWLGQSRDPRALALFEEILGR